MTNGIRIKVIQVTVRGGSPVPPTPIPAPTQGMPTGAPSVRQVKILNLDNLGTRVIAVNSIDDNKFPPAQYCDNGLYYGIEKIIMLVYAIKHNGIVFINRL